VYLAESLGQYQEELLPFQFGAAKQPIKVIGRIWLANFQKPYPRTSSY